MQCNIVARDRRHSGLVLIDNQEIIVEAVEIGMILERMKKRVKLLGEQGIAVNLSMFDPGSVESGALLGLNRRIFIGVKRFPICSHLADQVL